MNRKTAAVSAAAVKDSLTTARLDCAFCGAVTRVSLQDSPYPVKLPAACPCCLRTIHAYTWESADGPS